LIAKDQVAFVLQIVLLVLGLIWVDNGVDEIQREV
jgi:hypothetical protein